MPLQWIRGKLSCRVRQVCHSSYLLPIFGGFAEGMSCIYRCEPEDMNCGDGGSGNTQLTTCTLFHGPGTYTFTLADIFYDHAFKFVKLMHVVLGFLNTTYVCPDGKKILATLVYCYRRPLCMRSCVVSEKQILRSSSPMSQSRPRFLHTPCSDIYSLYLVLDRHHTLLNTIMDDCDILF